MNVFAYRLTGRAIEQIGFHLEVANRITIHINCVDDRAYVLNMCNKGSFKYRIPAPTYDEKMQSSDIIVLKLFMGL